MATRKKTKRVTISFNPLSMFKGLRFPKIRVKASSYKTTKLKRFFLGALLTIFTLLVLDFGSYYYFRNQVVAYSTKSGIVITKSQVSKRLFELNNQLTPITLQQLINDILIEKLAYLYASKENVHITDAQITAFLKQTATQNPNVDINDPILRENVRKFLLLKELAVKDSITISEEEIRKFFNENKDALFKDKKFNDVKDDIKEYLENQKIQEQIIAWLEQKRKEEGFIDLLQTPINKYTPGTGLRTYIPILIKSLFTL